MVAILKGTLTTSKSFDAAAPVKLRFELTNTGSTDVFVLKWFTPLEGLNSDCLSIKRNGKTKIPYDGPLIKRGTPGPEDYVFIRAGQTIVADVNVSESYAVSRPAEYHVALNIRGLEHLPATGKGQRTTKAVLAKKSPTKQQLVGGLATFKVTKSTGKSLTRGQAARQASKTLAKSQKKTALVGAARATAAPLPPNILGGTTAQQTQVQKAHVDGFNLCQKALKRLVDNARYREWFGSHTARRFSKVKSAYTRILGRMKSVTFSYDLSSTGCRSGVFGYTYKNTTTIWFCGSFWDATARGTDSKAGTIVHEHSHCDARTDDIAYGQDGARTLAAGSPDLAVKNADNYEYYAGG